MSSACKLRLDWCSHEAAKYAVMKWHYSQAMPAGKLVKIGVWENDAFVGVVIYGRGANNNMLKKYKLKMNQGCELVRVALTKHITPVSRIIAISLKLLKRQYPTLRLIISYADTEQGHHGGIYQAGGWLYTGKSNSATEWIINGKRVHNRSYSCMIKRGVKVKATKVKGSQKHKYVMPLDNDIAKLIEQKTYPKQACVV